MTDSSNRHSKRSSESSQTTSSSAGEVVSRSKAAVIVGKATPLLIIFAVAIAVMLVAELPLASWAEASQANHALQHLLIFAAGLAAGGAGIDLNHLRKRSR